MKNIFLFPSFLLAMFATLGLFTASVGVAESGAPSRVEGKPVNLSGELHGLIGDSLLAYESYRLDLASLARQAQEHRRLHLDLGELSLTLDLLPSSLRTVDPRGISSSGTVESISPCSTVFRGEVAGDRGSRVYVVASPTLFEATVRTPEGSLYIVPARRFPPPGARRPSAEIVVVYRDENRLHKDHAARCPVSRADAPPEGPGGRAVPVLSTSAVWVGDTVTATVATDADYSYYEVYGQDTNCQIQNLLSEADEVFTEDFGVSFTLGYQNVWDTSASNPYTTTASGALLKEFRNYWNTNFTAVTRDFAYLFSNENLDGNTIGRAYVGQVWANQASAYGLTGKTSEDSWVLLHELGHLFDSSHDCQGYDLDDDDCGDCTACQSDDGPIMCPCIQDKSSGFSDLSICVIEDWIGRYGQADSNS
ncbi:MAG: M12 family metallo-peptidase [Acidobacteriota bacterium]